MLRGQIKMERNHILAFSLFIFLFFIFIANSASAFPIGYPDNRTGNESCNNVLNFTGGVTASAGLCQVTSNSDDARYLMDLDEGTNSANISLLTKIRVVSCPANARILSAFKTNSTLSTELDWRLRDVAGGIRIHSAQTPDTCTISGWNVDNTWQYLRVTTDSRTNTVTAIINESSANMCTIPKGSGFPDDFWVFGDSEGANDGCVVDFDNLTFVNGTKYTSNVPSDFTPPSMTYYNITSGSGCENWNTDKNNACLSDYVLPSVQFNTDENAFCAIAGGKNATGFNLNYTHLGASRQCTGAASGQGGTSHLCTLSLQDELIHPSNYLFISCEDESGNENSTSTSGPLAINMTGLEANARDSIAIGINNALITGYSLYADQRVYARNSANGQNISRFDKVAKKSNKIWAFNSISVGESFANMFNITPVFYTLEFENKTTSYMINQTELLINSTK
jgi:hypothetical protein